MRCLLAVALICLASSVYCFADEPVCTQSDDGKTCSTPSGDLYEGEFDDEGLPHGVGKYFYTSGENYEGEFAHGVLELSLIHI